MPDMSPEAQELMEAAAAAGPEHQLWFLGTLASAGEAALAPVGVPHTYRVESRQGARWLNITTHGDFESFARELSRPAERNELPPPQVEPTPEQTEALVAVGREHGIELVSPPLAS
jgi:hypothetical protein